MVISRTLLRNRAMMGGTPSEILADVNHLLSEGNATGYFVTVWIAILEISTGKGLAANAGHEHPALRKKDGRFEMVKYRHSPAVATMDGIPFREHEFRLEPGDRIYVYTDGVTEAINEKEELFGEDRLLEALNRKPECTPEELLRGVKEEIDSFAGEAVQFDDITMLALDYTGPERP
jgi:sigma-B regulation protein RsbU (phosphoserine phosphatase)